MNSTDFSSISNDRCDSTCKNDANSILDLHGKSYTHINDLKDGQRKNVFVVVNEIIKSPAKTAKGDFHQNVAVVDPSCTLPNMKKDLLLQLFSSSTESPVELERGDILRISSAKPVTYRGKLQAIVYNSRGIVKFSSEEPNNIVTPHSENNKYKINSEDEAIVLRLREWWLTYSNINAELEVEQISPDAEAISSHSDSSPIMELQNCDLSLLNSDDHPPGKEDANFCSFTKIRKIYPNSARNLLETLLTDERLIPYMTPRS